MSSSNLATTQPDLTDKITKVEGENRVVEEPRPFPFLLLPPEIRNMIYGYSARPEKSGGQPFPPLLFTVSKQLREECLPIFFKGLELEIDWYYKKSSLRTPEAAEVSVELCCSLTGLDLFKREATRLGDLPEIFTHLKTVVLVFSTSVTTLNFTSLSHTKAPATLEITFQCRSEPEGELELTLSAALHAELDSSIKRATCLGKSLTFSLELCGRLTTHIVHYLSCIARLLDDGLLDDDI